MASNSGENENNKVAGRYSDVDEYGFHRDKDFDYKSYENFFSEYAVVLARRASRWDKLLNGGKKTKVKMDSRVKRFCRKGIPMQYRQMVWMEVSGAQRRLDKNPGLYSRLHSEYQTDASDQELLDAIDTDIDRTFPGNKHFSIGKKKQGEKRPGLERILTAVGRYKKDIGYCQGMNYIAALLLLVIENEESVFWLFISLLEDILPAYYEKKMIGLRTEMEVLADLVRERNPAVSLALEKEDLNWSLLISKWFICLYIDILPTETVLRIWDVLFTDGSKILFRAALHIIDIRSDKVRQAKDMPEIVSAFRDISKEDEVLECHVFMQECFNEEIPLRMSQIKALRKTHEIRLTEEDRIIDMRRNRQIN